MRIEKIDSISDLVVKSEYRGQDIGAMLISNLPTDYPEYIDLLDTAINSISSVDL